MAEFRLKERAFQFSVSVIKHFLSISLNSEFLFLKKQLYRSVTSIGANIIEGSGGASKKELARYLQIALRSSTESTYWLKLIKEIFDNPKNEKLDELIAESESITKILGKSLVSIKTSLATNN
jgi:four helix bundle protein